MDTMETPLYDLIKNKICEYEISHTDTKSSKEQLRESLSEYLEIPTDDIHIILDEIEIVSDYFTDKQIRRMLKVFEKIYKIEPHYGDQVRVTIYLTEDGTP
jgi:transposase-like protein